MTNDLRDAIIIGGGQSGLAVATALRRHKLQPTILEAGDRAVGSWPHYYDSLTLFSPAAYSAFPDAPFPGDPRRYPHRDEVIAYLADYASRIDADIRLHHRVTSVSMTPDGFAVQTSAGATFETRAVVAATGGFGNPHLPALPGMDSFTGQVIHSSQYRNPAEFAGARVVVVGAGNSAVQIAVELAEHAKVTIASRQPVRFVPQRPFGLDVHTWFAITRLDTARWTRAVLHGRSMPVLDTGRYADAIRAAAPDQRRLWTSANENRLTWPDGRTEEADTVILATGYRPNLPYLRDLDALDAQDMPRHRDGASTAHPGLAYVGLEYQRSLSSATLRGVAADARHVAATIARSLARTNTGRSQHAPHSLVRRA